ncbi:UvrB/UvrC motif-containing protein [Halalkalibacter urbisdiaboli]|uniref:UvrB/UvrC motif-containing protein n=1 Tax=Halalkalibacter urbisdiaboli TaxID=1960589 RepID=UPI000B4500E0|nr:UvrB/UvrC motif-containing protein [Halalkalibacter urbisdiaboli]
MKCQDCGQRQATLHFTKIINGEKTEFHICEQCAREKGEHFPGSNSFSIHQLLSGLLHFEQPMKTDQEKATPDREFSCEKCGMSYEQFTRVGRFGCAHCYESFSSKLDPLLKRVHSGNHSHAGKIPVRIGGGIQLQRKIDSLKEQLKTHINQEEFELAAEVRDEIRALERQKNNQREG